MQLVGHLQDGARLGDGVAAIGENLIVDDRVGPRAVIGANPGELGHGGHNHGPRRVRVEEVVGPEASGRPTTCQEHNRGIPGAVALEVEIAASDISPPGDVIARRLGRRRHRSAGSCVRRVTLCSAKNCRGESGGAGTQRGAPGIAVARVKASTLLDVCGEHVRGPFRCVRR